MCLGQYLYEKVHASVIILTYEVFFQLIAIYYEDYL